MSFSYIWNQFKQKILCSAFVLFLLCITITVLSYFYFFHHEEMGKELVREMFKGLEEKGLQENSSKIELFRIVFWNNLFLALVMLLTGFIPLLILPLTSTFLTFFALGTMLSFFEINSGKSFELFVFGILPHGIFEFLGFIVASSLGFYLSKNIFLKCFSKNRKQIPLKHEIKSVFISFLFFCLPLIVLGAFMEGFITPHIREAFLTI